MDDKSTDSRPTSPPDWRRLHALGLPSGSIRALLAVMIFATTWGLLILRPSQDVPDYLSDLLFIIMGHYFASRGRADHGGGAGPAALVAAERERPARAHRRAAWRWPSCSTVGAS